MNETQATQNEKKVGPIVATLIIVLVLIIAALYLFASKVNQPAIPTDFADEQTVVPTGDAELDSLQSELGNIGNDLDGQNF